MARWRKGIGLPTTLWKAFEFGGEDREGGFIAQLVEGVRGNLRHSSSHPLQHDDG